MTASERVASSGRLVRAMDVGADGKAAVVQAEVLPDGRLLIHDVVTVETTDPRKAKRRLLPMYTGGWPTPKK